MRLVPLLLVLATGCYAQVAVNGIGPDGDIVDPKAAAAAAVDADPDGDGLDSETEEGLGLDPQNADTDGDEFNDGDEIAANADPLDAEHHPYEGGWPIGACRTEITGTGTEEGDVAYDFGLLDQFGDTVRLYDFCDRTILLIFAGFW